MLPCATKVRPRFNFLRFSSISPSLISPLPLHCKRFKMGSTEKDDIEKAYEATKVEYRRLGKSGFKVSVPILGAMSFGDKRWAPWVIEEEEAYPLLKAAYDRGLTTWDTANMYSNGASEEIIGKALKKFDIPRHKVFILTKCWTYVGEKPSDSPMSHSDIVPQTKDYVNQGGLSRGAIFRAVDASLKRLQTDYIDLLQIHRFDPNTPIEETMEALNDLVRWGKVHYIGASSMWAYRFAQMQFCAEKNGWTKFISMQNHYSLLYREEEREMLKFCDDTGVGVIPWGPLFAGMLARPLESHGSTERSSNKAAPTEMQKNIVGRVEELAKKKGWSMTVVALAWIKTKCSSPIVGFSSVKRIDEAVEVTGKELTEEEIKYLEEPYEAQAVVGHS